MKEGTCANWGSCTNDVLLSNVQGVRALMPACWNNVHPFALGNCITRPLGGWSSLSSTMLFVLLVVMVVLPLVLLLWFILFVRGAGWNLKDENNVWIVLFQILHSFLRRPHTDRFSDGVTVKVTAEQESWFLWKKCHRNGENRNPEDSCRNYQPSYSIRCAECQILQHRLLSQQCKVA